MDRWVTQPWSAPKERNISNEKEKDHGANEISKEKVKKHGAKEFGKLAETMFMEIGRKASPKRRSRAIR